MVQAIPVPHGYVALYLRPDSPEYGQLASDLLRQSKHLIGVIVSAFNLTMGTMWTHELYRGWLIPIRRHFRIVKLSRLDLIC